METYKIPKDAHRKHCAAIDRLQTQQIPCLSVSVFNQTDEHGIMLFDQTYMIQKGIMHTFVVVKGIETWAAYYLQGEQSPEYVAYYGRKLSKQQVSVLIHCEGDLIEKYRD